MGKNAPEGRPGDGSPVSDEEWAEFVRRAGEGSGADAPKEPSARARMVAARLRAEDERRRREGKPAEPEGWRTGPAWQERSGSARKRRRLVAVLGVLVAVGLSVVAVRPELVTGEAAREESAPLAAETARPTAAPSAELFPDRPTLKEPFRGSPAVGWAAGAAGIELPEAKAVGGMSKEQVAHALRSTKELLVASNLDPATLRGEWPRAALKLLDPLQKDGHGALEKALRAPAKEQDPLWMFSRFDPSQVRPAGDVVRTRGRMTFGKGDRSGEVRVYADYTFVYPVVKAKPGADEVTRTVVRRQLTVALYDPAEVITTRGRLYVFRMDMNSGNSDCSKDGDGFLRPQFTEDLAGGAPEVSGPSVDPYDRSRDLDDLSQECGAVTRT
ncbi:hypothetical protein ACIQMR_29475 [Streptomyces sp. NPDC091376]|uniref:hypothetical protein n=1 Tax=Streptomyces sp. NPDC091376 TaxID=3365994 RepID=UPI0037FAEA61